ncbi:hypothetical protein JCM11251_000035 [Rhodosporidiobolus azoricus]
MSAAHPLAPKILPYCKRYPAQASALFQTFVDLSLAQQWRDLEVVELEECGCAVLRGRPKTPKKAAHSVVLPTGLATPTSLAELTAVLNAVASRFASTPLTSSSSSDVPIPTHAPTGPSKTDDADTTTVYLGIVEKDSSIVYYVLRKGIVSPKEVPE